jgi:hypothetical protein
MMNTESGRLLAMGDPRRASADRGGPPSRPARCPTTPRSDSRHLPSKRPTLASIARSRLRQSRADRGQSGRRRSRPSQPCGYLPTATLHDLPVRHSGHGSARTPDTSPWTPDGGHPDAQTPHRTLDSSSGGHARVDTGRLLRTPDAGRGHGHGDEGTAGIRTSWTAAPNGFALDTQGVFLGTAPAAHRNHDGSAVGHLPARDRRSQYQAAAARPHRRPSRASAHCCRVLDLDGTRRGQWDKGKGGWVQGQVGEEVLMEVVEGC